MSWYIIKIFLCSGILFGYYRLFLRNKRFHQYNRFYLLAALILSVTIPLIKIPLSYSALDTQKPVIYHAIDALTVGHWEKDASQVQVHVASSNDYFSTSNILYLLYGLGVLLLLSFFARSLWHIRKIAKKYTQQYISTFKFYNTHEPGTPFSFLKSIFWNDQLDLQSEKGQQVFRHEAFHVEQKHSADIILAELFTAFCWLNPFFHLIKRELKAIHEFLADDYAISGNDRYRYAELLIQHSITYQSNSINNYFFQNHIKRRIAMITHFNKTKYGYWSRVLALPLVALIIGVVSVKARQLAADVKQSFASISTPIPTESPKKEDLAYKEAITANHQITKRATTNEYKEGTPLDIEKVRTLLANKSTVQEVVKLFGQPGKRTLSDADEAWYYGEEGNRLMIDFNVVNDKLRSFFYHFVPANSSKSISYEAVKSIKKDITTISDIKQRLGEPTQIKMSPETEDWFYQTGDSWLQVEFKTGKDKVLNFFYNQEEAKKNTEDHTSIEYQSSPVNTSIEYQPSSVISNDTLPFPKDDTISVKQMAMIIKYFTDNPKKSFHFTFDQKGDYMQLSVNDGKMYYIRKEELEKYKLKSSPGKKDDGWLQLPDGKFLLTVRPKNNSSGLYVLSDDKSKVQDIYLLDN